MDEYKSGLNEAFPKLTKDHEEAQRIKSLLHLLQLDPQAELSLSAQLKEQITWLVATRRLKEGDFLPSVRMLADHLRINLNTVRSAYKKLEADGLVATRKGVGTTVLPFNPYKIAENSTKTRSFTIGVVLPDLGSTAFLPFLEGIEEIAQDVPSLLFISTAQNNPLKANIAIDRLIAKGVDGLIVASQGYFRQAEGSAAGRFPPIVYVDEPDVLGHIVLLDSEGAGWQATRHLIEHGHDRVGLLTCPLEWANVRECYLGYRRAMEEAGLSVDPALIATAPAFDIEAGHETARRLLERSDPPAAIYAIQDMLAIGAMQAIKERGLRVGADIAVAGYNDLPLAAIVDPPLTTVTAPVRQLGVEAMRILQRLIAGEEVKPKRIQLDTHLVIRSSCGCHSE